MEEETYPGTFDKKLQENLQANNLPMITYKLAKGVAENYMRLMTGTVN